MATPRRALTRAEEERRSSDEGGHDYQQEMEVAELVSRGIQYLQDKSAAFEKLAFEVDEDCGKCKIVGTLDNYHKVTEGLGRRMPRLMLHGIDLKEVTPKTELCLSDVDVFGYVVDLDEAAEECTLQVTALGLDEGGEETSLKEYLEKVA